MQLAWSKIIQPKARKSKLTNLGCYCPNCLQTPHTSSSGPSTVWSTFRTSSLEQPTAASLYFALSPQCLETYSPSTAFSHLGIEKVMWDHHIWWIGGLQHLWDLMFSQDVLGGGGGKKKKKKLNCQQFWDKFPWDAFHSQVFYQNGLYWTK
jgi:hypothetical protein